jgi:hypothetical protein
MSTPAPEVQADALVGVDNVTLGGPLFVQLKGATGTVRFGLYENPDLAYMDAVKVRHFLAEVIMHARRDSNPCSGANLSHD